MKYMLALSGCLVLAACQQSPVAPLSHNGLEVAGQDHVSGSVVVTLPCMPGCNRSGGELQVTVHEGKRIRGDIKWTAFDRDGNVVRTMRWDVTGAVIDPPTGQFVAVVIEDSSISDSRLGHYYEFYAMDNGSPGTNGDLIKWTDHGPSAPSGYGTGPLTVFPIVDGNLTVK